MNLADSPFSTFGTTNGRFNSKSPASTTQKSLDKVREEMQHNEMKNRIRNISNIMEEVKDIQMILNGSIKAEDRSMLLEALMLVLVTKIDKLSNSNISHQAYRSNDFLGDYMQTVREQEAEEVQKQKIIDLAKEATAGKVRSLKDV